MPTYDVFVCYRSSDRRIVSHVVQQMVATGLQVWFDEANLDAGAQYPLAIAAAIQSSRSAVVFVGDGPFDLQSYRTKGELSYILDRRNSPSEEQPGFRVIPVLVNGAKLDLTRTPLAGTTAITWGSADEQADIRKLYRAVKGQPLPDATTSASPSHPREMDLAGRLGEDLATRRQGEHVTYFLGPSHIPWSTGPTSNETLARLLLADQLKIMCAGDNFVPTLDIASFCYEVFYQDTELEARLREDTFPTTPQLYTTLAEWLAHVDRADRRRGHQAPCHVIVTTNTHLAMERALLRAGVAFDRYVQLEFTGYDARLSLDVRRIPKFDGNTEDCTDLDLNDFVRLQPVEPQRKDPKTSRARGPRSLAIPDTSELDLPIGERVVLYKFLGSVDVPRSCAVSADKQADRLITHAHGRLIPKAIKPRADSQILILGYSPLDPEFRLLRNTWITERPIGARQYVIYPGPTKGFAPSGMGRFEVQLWPKLKERLAQHNFRVVEQQPHALLTGMRIGTVEEHSR